MRRQTAGIAVQGSGLNNDSKRLALDSWRGSGRTAKAVSEVQTEGGEFFGASK